MSTRASRGWSAALMASVLLGAIASGPAMAQSGTARANEKAEKIDLAKAEKRDMLIFRTGSKVDGVILEETDTTVRMLVIVGTLRSEMTYNKSEIIEIKRDAYKPAETPAGAAKADASGGDSGGASDPKSESGGNDGGTREALVDVNGKPIPPGTTKVYVLNFGGEFGRDVSRTPVKAAMDDVAKIQPDILIVRFDQAFGFFGEVAPDYAQIGRESYDLLEKAREIDTLIGDRIASDPAFVTKPRQIAWIKKAMGPAAFLPFVFREIYMTSDGYFGGIGGLDQLFKGQADDVVAEKQISLRLGRAIGLAEKGKHDGRIMKAMSRGNYVLSYRIVGGQTEFLENQMPPDPTWFVLKDDGPTNEAHRDTMQDLIRMKGNDYLTLDAEKAFDIGLSRGTADSVDELLHKMGVERSYALVKNKSPGIFKDWSTNVTKTEEEVTRLLRSYRSVQVKPPGQYEQRSAARGQRKNILRQIQTIVKEYFEAINPERVGDPEQLIHQLNVVIDRIETEQRMDKRP